MTITFFGHRDTPAYVQSNLENKLKAVLKEHQNIHFLIGDHGSFDQMALHTVRCLAQCYPEISYDVVLAYLPRKGPLFPHSLYPEGLEEVHPRYAIHRRNEWMIANSNMAITYVTHSYGGAARYQRMAKQKGLIIYNLYYDADT